MGFKREHFVGAGKTYLGDSKVIGMKERCKARGEGENSPGWGAL